jgi:hypothetical protein
MPQKAGNGFPSFNAAAVPHFFAPAVGLFAGE